MATCDLPTPKVGLPSSAALHQLKNLVQHDPAFAQALQATTSTAAAARLAAAHGIPAALRAVQITPCSTSCSACGNGRLTAPVWSGQQPFNPGLLLA